jgi:large subunit ribosomal protein L15
MERYQLKKPESIKRRKRVGCGPASGKGKTCGRGMNGQLSRSGSKKRSWFEGGQMPLQRRVPKRGFNNIFKSKYQIVNLSQLEKLNAGDIDHSVMKKNGLIKKSDMMVKVLGKGEVSKSFKVYADAFSNSAVEKIKKAGGEAIVQKFPEKKSKNSEETG